jgi:hypothetical protein
MVLVVDRALLTASLLLTGTRMDTQTDSNKYIGISERRVEHTLLLFFMCCSFIPLP